jgi:hypothetical protein
MRKVTFDEVKSYCSDQSTVGLVVHGIGDHSPISILEESERGFFASVPGAGITSERLDLSDLLPADARGFSLSATRFTDGSRSHLIIALVWSGMISRLPSGGDVLIRRSFGKLLGIVGRLARLPFLGSGALWIAALTGLAFVTAGFFSLVVLCLPLLLLLLYFSRSAAESGAGHDDVLRAYYWGLERLLPASIALWFEHDQWTILLVWVFLFFAYLSVYQIAALQNYADDVLRYLCDREHRLRLLTTIQSVIERVDSLRGGARFVVVGHSLGSVAVTQALVKARIAGSPILLVTLGSPLQLMARIFPKILLAPEDVLGSLITRKIVWRWLNAYREADIVGRSLHLHSEAGSVEYSLGDGGHTGYFADANLWRKLMALLASDWDETLEAIQNGSSLAPLAEVEQHELTRLQNLWRTSGALLLFSCLSGFLLARNFLLIPAGDVLHGWIQFLWIVYSIAGLCFLSSLVAWIACLRGPREPARRQLQAFRLWRLPVAWGPLLSAGALTVVALTCLALALFPSLMNPQGFS